MIVSRLFTCFALAGLCLTAACDRGGGTVGQEEASQSDDSMSTGTDATAAKAHSKSPAGEISRAHAGEAAPDLPFQTMNGKEKRLSDFAGQPLLVNFWATWCAPCVKELPALQRLAERHEDEMMLLIISQDFDGADAVKPFLQKQKLTLMHSYLDPDNRWLTPDTGIEVLPTSIYYDGDGKEVWRVTGDLDWDSEESDALFAKG